jgi:hypothetical protein
LAESPGTGADFERANFSIIVILRPSHLISLSVDRLRRDNIGDEASDMLGEAGDIGGTDR